MGIERLDRMLECAVCGRKQPPTVSEPWAFRLSEFVLHAIKDYGVLPIVWCLRTMQEEAHTASFYFLGPTALFYDTKSYEKDEPDAEFDLLVMIDGRVSLCEVKNSDREIDSEKLAELALKVRPDEVVIAVMQEATTRLRDDLSLLKSNLINAQIQARLITLDDNQDERHSGTWLPISGD